MYCHPINRVRQMNIALTQSDRDTLTKLLEEDGFAYIITQSLDGEPQGVWPLRATGGVHELIHGGALEIRCTHKVGDFHTGYVWHNTRLYRDVNGGKSQWIKITKGQDIDAVVTALMSPWYAKEAA